MKQVKQKAWMVLAFAGLAALLSFSSNGGDHFEVWLNKHKLVEQAVYKNEAMKTISLRTLRAGDQLSIYYSHCGTTGKSRSLSIRDAKNTVLKTWHFPDASGKSFMSCKASEILGLRTEAKNLLLYYSSKELPEGKALVSLSRETGETVSR